MIRVQDGSTRVTGTSEGGSNDGMMMRLCCSDVVFFWRQIRSLREKISTMPDGPEKTAMRKRLKVLYDHSNSDDVLHKKRTKRHRFRLPRDLQSVSARVFVHLG